MCVEEMLTLVPAGLTADLKHDVIVALLEAQPATEVEAHAVTRRTLNRIRERERKHRRRAMPILIEPATDNADPLRAAMLSALDQLAYEERVMLMGRYLDDTRLTRNQRRKVSAAKESLRESVRF